MKSLNILPLAALAAAFVVPDAKVFDTLSVEHEHKQSPIAEEWNAAQARLGKVAEITRHAVESKFEDAKNSLDSAFDSAHELKDEVDHKSHDAISWSYNKADEAWDFIESLKDKKEHHGPPHHGPPHHGPPGHGPPHHGKPHCPHHGHDKPNETVYQLISKSKYTTKLASLINKYPDLVEALNGTEANYTIFAPTDKAFEKIPEHVPEPSEEKLKEVLSYHVSPDFYPAGRVLHTQTIPTLLKGEHLSSSPRPQRLSINAGLRGLTVNFYSRIIAINIFGTNGVIHGVDHILVPPPNVIEVVDLLPSEFSTLELALDKTGLLSKFNTTDHPGGTFFAPSNSAFKKLGPGLNMFLFSSHGQKYLKALLEYHVAVGATLYSDAVYVADPKDTSKNLDSSFAARKTCNSRAARTLRKIPAFFKRAVVDVAQIDSRPSGHVHSQHKSFKHYELDTMLSDKKLTVDIARFGPFTGMKVNGYARVVIKDGIASDGVIQTVGNVLIPPKKPTEDQEAQSGLMGMLRGLVGLAPRRDGEGTMCVGEFKARFAGLVEED